MNELLNKVSSYNIFNYLLPGVVFMAATGATITYFPFVNRDIVTLGFLYYFVGLAISRFGSLVLEPLLQRVSFLQHADYREYVAAEKKDDRLLVLGEVNNMYRTLCSLFFILLLLRVGIAVEKKFPFMQSHNSTILALILLITFLFAFRKQTAYVVKRIKANT